jgi:hypothetical protein
MTDTTDNAPERIWAFMPDIFDNMSVWQDEPSPNGDTVPYNRADLAPDPLRAVKVKPLVWEYHPAGAIAAPPTGHAYIIDTRMKGGCYSIKGFSPQRGFSSMDEAKAAAQADYVARIMSALTTGDSND